ncbi:MAG TPA: VWA domain-containing protein [Pyrinomonadaceae bacterium]|nr:VWA domain-containing protein [Pyrinomonadaceae bacterium]
MPLPPSNEKSSRAARRRATCAALLCAVVALPLASTHTQGLAQQQQQRQGERDGREDVPGVVLDSDEVVRVDTDLIMVEAAVTDAEGRPVRGLRAEDFKLYDDGVERPLAFFNVERRGGVERPVAVVFAVDVSGSMTVEEMMRVRDAVNAFAEGMRERPASFALMSFGMSAKVHQSFTRDPEKLNKAFGRLAREMNGLSTHTYDAVDDAVRLLVRHAPRTRERQPVRRAVVVVTDGFPVGDTVAPKTVIERANEAGVSVYTVTLPSFSPLLAAANKENVPLPTPLDVSGLAEKTGGTNVYATEKDFTPLFKALAEEVSSTYVLAFYPPEEKRRDGLSHSIRVEAPRGLLVRQSRQSYKGTDK